MAPAASSASGAGDSSLKWKKRKGEGSLGSSAKKLKRDDDDEEEDEDEEDEDEEEEVPAVEEDEDKDLASNLGLRESEIVPGRGQRISDFPSVVRQLICRPHPMVLAIVAVERSAASGLPIQIENISHGQLQALSAVLPDHSYLALAEPDKVPAYVCTPPALMEGKGVVKQFGNGVLLVPAHSDWFDPTKVHRIERQVVPHFFSGKSSDHTPERYMILRNMIVAKYLENPARKLSISDCHVLVPGGGSEMQDVSRVARFLDHWGIVNYLALADRSELKPGNLILREEHDGELNVDVAALKSIDSLVQFDRPRSSCRAEDPGAISSCSVLDLDRMIRERLSEHVCGYCSCPLTEVHYQSLKEADVSLCSNCYHEGRFVVGHSSVSFLRAESLVDSCEVNGDHWSDQETLLLLEALEVFNDNWNEIADHVGTKSKAQCMLHFLRLPVEDDLLESINVPGANSSNLVDGRDRETDHLSANGSSLSLGDEDAAARLPFANSGNPLMSLVAFLAAAMGPRVGAACAGAALSALAKEETRADRFSADNTNSPRHREEIAEGADNMASSALPLDKVKAAAMSGLYAAATKAKLFADQEEREIQRLVAGIVHHQLKRLEVKLKQFAEVEALLMKECEQAERTRQRLAAERVRLSSTRFASDPAGDISNRPAAMAAPAIGQTGGATAFYGGTPVNLPQISSFLARQQQAFPMGPRLPLSAIHASPSSNSSAGGAPSNHYPLLRPNVG